MASKKRRGKARRFGGRVKRRVKAAKPSIAIALGLGVPPLLAVTGADSRFGGGPIWSAGIGNKSTELFNRIKVIYTGAVSTANIGTAITSTGVKLGVAGFVVHGIASLFGVNRTLARMKWPIRI